MREGRDDMQKICELSNYDVETIMKDIFEAKRITKIKRHLKDDYISCNVYTEWESYDENGKKETLTCRDEVEIRNPFEYGSSALHAGDIPLKWEDFLKLKQFCYARGLVPNWIKDNPYLKKEVLP